MGLVLLLGNVLAIMVNLSSEDRSMPILYLNCFTVIVLLLYLIS